jgi:alanine dehydrogenase
MSGGLCIPDGAIVLPQRRQSGLQFSSVGGWVYQQAVKQKKGREIPTEWFLQDIRD